MLYVFHVDTGTMMTFEMRLALESVQTLKENIELACRIPKDMQVLLVSGGESLDDRSKVCTYSAGTDTNPIFLFSKNAIESSTPPSVSADYGSDIDFNSKMQEAKDLPAIYETVVHRAQLAHQFHEFAKKETRICESLVHDQHLQQQGWAAVIANLEDLSTDFKKRSQIFENSFNDYLNEHENYTQFLQYFTDDLQILAKIPIIPSLLENEVKEGVIDNGVGNTINEEDDEESKDVDDDDSNKEAPKTLLDWIASTDSRSSMTQLFEHCAKGLEQFDHKVFQELHKEIQTAVDASNFVEMKEVKGLGDRLFGLEQLMIEAKRYVREQSELAQSFAQNQNRAGILGDPSILPDLCVSHWKQLGVMHSNHNQICDIRRRCRNAKEELSYNLYQRLRWVMYVENAMVDANHKLVIYHDNLKRLRQHLEVLQQIHLAPTTYLSAVAEVVRRRAFSQAFLLWASELACHLLTIYNEEVTRRKEFQSIFDGHFLNALFPGMEDLPPSFATQAPSIFDSTLPKISCEDIEELKLALPDMTENLAIPDMSAITNFFLVKSAVKNDKVDDDMGIDAKLVEVVTEVGLASNLDQTLLKPAESETCLAPHGLAHLKDLDKGCESETDTEEFEKVCQSPLDLQFDKELSSPRPRSQDASTLTEVGDKSPLLPPKKPPRTFQKLTPCNECYNLQPQRAMSISGSNTESFTNLKNTSLESIDELSSLKNADSCYNSHHQQMHGFNSGVIMRSKSLSPRTPQSPRGEQTLSPNSPSQGHQPSDFVNEEYYIDESLPSSLSIETGNPAQGEYANQLSNANDVVALLQDNLQTSRSEHDRLKSILLQMALVSQQAMSQLRQELSNLKALYESQKSSIEMQYSSLNSSWENLAVERDNKEREIIRRITIDHELEISDYKKILSTTNMQTKTLQEEVTNLNNSVESIVEKHNLESEDFKQKEEEYKQEIANLRDKVTNVELEKEKAVKETVDRLNREHKVQIDSMRSRFRLVVDRSPSESNLEKIEKSDVNHETMMLQMKDDYEAEKQSAIEEVQKVEAKKWGVILEEKLQEVRDKFDEEKARVIEEVSRRVSEEKDKQIMQIKDREANLRLECMKYKNTLQQLTEQEFDTRSTELLEKVENLEKEKCQLETELSVERAKQLETHDMAASVVAVSTGSKIDAATSPVKQREKLTRSQVSLVREAKLSIESCNVGDYVLILWDSSHDSYTILQQGNSLLYFLHTDCLEPLGLKKLSSDSDKKMYCIGEVIEKEYCHARKAENRYKVPKGTKFYRVKVKAREMSKAQGQPHMTQSQTVGPAMSEHSVSDSACHSLPSTPTRGHFAEKETKIDSIKESNKENR